MNDGIALSHPFFFWHCIRIRRWHPGNTTQEIPIYTTKLDCGTVCHTGLITR